MSNQDEKSRGRNREQTHAGLLAAIQSLRNNRGKITFSSVARIAEVTPALIHNRYPDVAVIIQKELKETERGKLKKLRSDTAPTEETINSLRAEALSLNEEIRMLASLNEKLRRELMYSQAIANSKNVVPLKPFSGTD